MPEVIEYITIYVALERRVSEEYGKKSSERKDYHPRQKHHWHLLIENECFPNKPHLWTQCHTLETDGWQMVQGDRGLAENFEDYPHVSLATELRFVANSIIPVAKIDASKRKKFIQELTCMSDLVEEQRQHGETCRYFVERVIQWLNEKRDVYRVVYPSALPYPKNHEYIQKMYLRRGFIEEWTTEQPFRELPAPPPVPRTPAQRLRAKRSIFSIRTSNKVDRQESGSNSKANKAQSNPQISRPRPLAPEQYPSSDQAQSLRHQREISSRALPPTKGDTKNLEPRTFMLDSQDEDDGSASEQRPRRRASENPQSHRQRMAESIGGLVKRKSSPT